MKKTDQYKCQSYYDDDILQDCTCGKCGETDKQQAEKYESFNPNNPDHLKGFDKWVKKIKKRIEKMPKHYEGVLISKQDYNAIKKMQSAKSLLEEL